MILNVLEFGMNIQEPLEGPRVRVQRDRVVMAEGRVDRDVILGLSGRGYEITLTHICGKKRSNGRFTVVRQTIPKRLQAKLSEVKAELRRRWRSLVDGRWRRPGNHP
jgi:gamma-glutamyltranspeptidase